jgi:hypothetical protein
MKKIIAIWLAMAGIAAAEFVPVGVDLATGIMKPLGTNTVPGYTNYYNQLMWRGVYQTGNSGGNFSLDLTNITTYVGQATPFRLTRFAGTENPAMFIVAVSNTALATIAGGTSTYFQASSAVTQSVELSVIGLATGTTKLLVSATGYGGMSYSLTVSNVVDPATLDSDYDGVTNINEMVASQNPWGRVTSPYHAGDAPWHGSFYRVGPLRLYQPNEQGWQFACPEWTIEACVIATNSFYANEDFLIKRGGSAFSSPGYNYELGITNGYPYVKYADAQTNYHSVTSSVPIPLDKWTHLAASLGGTNTMGLSLYINGYTVASIGDVQSCMMSTGRIWIGGPRGGAVDNVRIWNSTRTAAELSAEMWSVINTPSNEPALLAEWRFDEYPYEIGPGSLTNYHRCNWAMNSKEPLNTNQALRVAAVDYYYQDTNLIFSASGADDWNNNRLPNWFEEFFGVSDPQGDPDSDGVDNYTEFICGTNPKQRDTDGDAIEDGDEDYDGDGLCNAGESSYGTRPDLADTDDDGLSDGLDVSFDQTAGTNSRLPTVGAAYSLIVSNDGLSRLSIPDWGDWRMRDTWTLMTRFKITSPQTNDCDFIARKAGSNYVFGLGMYRATTTRTNAYPGLMYNDIYGNRWVVLSSNAVQTNTWTHLAVTRNKNSYGIYVDGLSKASKYMQAEPVFSGGLIDNYAGLGFNGAIGSAGEGASQGGIYVADTVLTTAQIENNKANGANDTNDYVVAMDFYDFTNFVGVSSNAAWTDGHVENYSKRYPFDWTNAWRHAGTLQNGGKIKRAGYVVEKVDVLNPDGNYDVGSIMTCRVTFAEQVTALFGSPLLSLSVRGAVPNYAFYTTASLPSYALDFLYTVNVGDSSPALAYGSTNSLMLNGGYIRGVGNVPFKLTLPELGARNSMTFGRSVSIGMFGVDVVQPAPQHVNLTNRNGVVSHPTHTGAGTNIMLQVTWGTDYRVSVDSGVPQIGLTMTGVTRYAVCQTQLITSATNVLYFAYTPQSKDVSTNYAYAGTWIGSLLNYASNAVISGGSILWHDAYGNGGAADTNLPAFNRVFNGIEDFIIIDIP